MKKFPACLGILALTMALGACAASERKSMAPARAPAQAKESGPTAAKAMTPAAPAKAELATLKDKASYGVGLDVGTFFKQAETEISEAALLQGLRDGLAGAKPQLDENELMAAMQSLRESAMQKEQQRAKEKAEKDLKEAQAYLDANAKKQGVVVLPSGTQYAVVTAADGAIPKEGDELTFNYRGSFIDDKEFESSAAGNNGKPMVVPFDNLPLLWKEAMKLMKVGSKVRFFFAPNKEAGSNVVLIFDVELLGAASAPKEATADAAKGDAKEAPAETPKEAPKDAPKDALKGK